MFGVPPIRALSESPTTYKHQWSLTLTNLMLIFHGNKATMNHDNLWLKHAKSPTKKSSNKVFDTARFVTCQQRPLGNLVAGIERGSVH